MGKLEASHFSRAGNAANERLIDAVLDPDRYEDGTAFIASDSPEFRSILASTVAEHRPIAIVYPDGREVVASPQVGAIAAFLSMLLEFLSARRKRTKSRDAQSAGEPPNAISLPAEYRVEIRDRDRVPVG